MTITGFSAVPANSDKADNWDDAGLLKPSVLRETSGYKIWYDGADFEGNTQIGLARSKDGLNWRKAPQNPVLDGDPGAWDAVGEHAAFVMKDGNLYKMWYEGSDGNVRQLGYATSHNGISWKKYLGYRVVGTKCAEGEWHLLDVVLCRRSCISYLHRCGYQP